MPNSDPLVWYGIGVIISVGCFIIVPYLRGKNDLLLAWNVLLLGIVSYVGIGSLEVRYGVWWWKNLQWWQPSTDHLQWYMVYSTVFIITLLLAYYYNPIGRTLPDRVLRTWPPVHTGVYLFVMGFCGIIAFTSLFTYSIVFVGPLMLNLSHKAAIFAAVFAFMLWYERQMNPFWLVLFIFVLIAAGLFSMVVAGGRRLLLSVLLAPILGIYWTRVRYWKPRYCLGAIAIAACSILLISTVYSSFRWFSKGAKGEERTTATVVEQVMRLPERENVFDHFLANKLNYFSQLNAHYAMLAMYFIDAGQLEPIPLNTLRFIATYPIPRRVWAGKPTTISITLAHDMAGQTRTTWPVGIAGHGAYEGGVLALILYAILAAFAIRFFDSPIRAQPSNPFLISVHAAALPNIFAIPRGDMGTMTIEAAEAFVFVIILNIICRVLFGTERSQAQSRALHPQRNMMPGQPLPRRQFRPQ